MSRIKKIKSFLFMTLFVSLSHQTDSTLASHSYSNIPLAHKIGAMLMVGFAGSEPHHPAIQKTLRHIATKQVGGVILFRYNIETAPQLKNLISTLKEENPHLWVAVDQEGGKVQRLSPKQGFKSYPSPYDVAYDQDPEEAAVTYNTMAEELASYGINLNLAPCVDVNNEDDPSPIIGGYGRSFSSDPEKVITYAQSFINSHRRHGVRTAIKHFPGHGYAQGDTHLGLVDATLTAHPSELIPFAFLIRAQKIDMVMTSHLLRRDLDAIWPATLSQPILRTLLREKLNYQGVVISDDLHMGAMLQNYSLEQIVTSAINAGCDLLIFSNNDSAAQNVENYQPDYDLAPRLIELIQNGIKKGTIKEEYIHQAYERLQRLMHRFPH